MRDRIGIAMKTWIPAATLGCLVACLENPGVDRGLSTRHDRLSSDFIPFEGSRIRVRLERDSGVTRMFLSDIGSRPLDSISYFLQVDYDGFRESLGKDYSFPYTKVAFRQYALSESRGSVALPAAQAELDLGVLQDSLPRMLDKADLNFIPFRAKRSGIALGHPRSGYYEGVWTDAHSSGENHSGGVRGIIGLNGAFYFLGNGGNTEFGNMGGRLEGDSISSAEYVSGWYGVTLSKQWESVRLPVGSPTDSLVLLTQFRIRMQDTPFPRYDSLELRMALWPRPEPDP
jgi:hypothetical protein